MDKGPKLRALSWSWTKGLAPFPVGDEDPKLAANQSPNLIVDKGPYLVLNEGPKLAANKSPNLATKNPNTVTKNRTLAASEVSNLIMP